jgi:hypothetical protein
MKPWYHRRGGDRDQASWQDRERDHKKAMRDKGTHKPLLTLVLFLF